MATVNQKIGIQFNQHQGLYTARAGLVPVGVPSWRLGAPGSTHTAEEAATQLDLNMNIPRPVM